MYVIVFFFIANYDIRRQFFLLEDMCKKTVSCLFLLWVDLTSLRPKLLNWPLVQERIFQIYFSRFVLFTKLLIEYFYSL